MRAAAVNLVIEAITIDELIDASVLLCLSVLVVREL
jgi:hypothetical protein